MLAKSDEVFAYLKESSAYSKRFCWLVSSFRFRSHSDIRPYGCKQCNFNFKTKGNLTKHLQSKTHRRRMAEREKQGTMEHDSDSDHDRLEIASPSCTASTCSNDPLSDDEW